MKRFVALTISAAAWPAAAVSQTAPAAPPQTDPAARPAAPAQSVALPVPRTTFIHDMDAEFRRMDADKNGILTKKEIEDFQRAVLAAVAQNRNRALFAVLDTDKNGTITGGEFAALPMNLPRPNSAPVLAQTDGNRDGQVSLVEYRSAKLVNFDRMDTDKDSVVSIAELKAAGLIKQ